MASSASAQGGGAGGAGRRPTQRPTAKPAAKPAADTTGLRRTPAGYVLDFQDQPLRVVLSAIAEAGALNVALSDIPARNVTLRMSQALSRDTMAIVLRTVAEANGLKVTQGGPLITIEGPVPTPVETPLQRQQALLQQLAQANQPPPVKLFTYRLKHVSATALAPVLTNLFAGYGLQTIGGPVFLPNGAGGFQIFNNGQPNVANGIAPGVAGGGAGRGARAGFGNNGANAPVNPNAAANPNTRGATGVGLVPAPGAAANAQQIAAGGGALSSQANQIRIVAEESSNSLLVRATDSDWALIQQIVQGIDLRPLQVLIEVTIAEVTRTNDFNFGVTGSIHRHKTNGVDSIGVQPGAASTSSVNDFILALTGGHGAVDYNVAISALEERGDVRVLSLPVIIAQNNKQATLTVGQSVPFVQVSQSVPQDPTSFVQTVQYQDVGTVLQITPTINPDGYVNLQVTQQDNSATTEVQFNAPIISKREATTQIFIHDGQTTVIGGLSGNQRNHTTSGIPVLSRIPLLGPLLFGSVQRDDQASELFLFLTPHIISSDADIDLLRDAVKNHSELLKTMPVGPNIIPGNDTLHLPGDSLRRLDSTSRRDSVRRADSLRTLRRRPPGGVRRDTTAAASIAARAGSTLWPARREER